MDKYIGKDNLDVMNLAINYNNMIYNWLDESKYDTILDFGAGNGEYCNRVSKSKITAVELDDSLRSILKCKSVKVLNELEATSSFDLIYTLNVLEHIEDDAKIVEELVSLLKTNGVLKILVPARMEIYSEMDNKVGHFRRYNKEQLEELCRKNNLQIESVYYFDFLGYGISFIYKYLNNSGEISSRSIKVYDQFIFPVSSFLDKLGFKNLIGKNLMLVARKINEK